LCSILNIRRSLAEKSSGTDFKRWNLREKEKERERERRETDSRRVKSGRKVGVRERENTRKIGDISRGAA